MHERRLHVHADEHAEPDQVNPHLLRHRRQQRNDDEGDLEIVEEEGQEEHEHVDEHQEAEDAARQVRQHPFDPQIAIDAPEGEAEHRRADQDEHHHGRELERGVHPFLEQLPGEATVHDRERQGSDRPHRAALGGRGQAHQDGAEDHEDQHQGRHHRHHASDEQHAEAGGANLLRQRGHLVRPDDADDEDPQAEQTDQNEARDEGARIHVPDRAAHGIGQHHQHQRGRNDLGDGAGSGDDAGRHFRVVAVARHHRQRDQSHGDHRGCHGACNRPEQRPDQDDRIGKTSADRAEQLPHRVEEILGQPAALQYRAHEGEERDRQQQLVGRDAENALGQRLQQNEVEIAQLDGEKPETQAYRRERKRNRITDEQDNDEPREHQRRHQLE